MFYNMRNTYILTSMANRLRSVGGGGGVITGSCVLGASFELPPVFLLASKPFKPGRFF